MADSGQWAKDAADIESLIILFTRGHDFGSSYYAKCMLEDGECDYGVFRFTTLAELQQMRDTVWSYSPENPGGFLWTMHVISNRLIEIDGDTGRGQFYTHALHGIAGKDGQPVEMGAGAMYKIDAVRTPDGWRIKRLRCRLIWGPPDPDGLMPMLPTMWNDPTRLEVVELEPW